MVIVLTVLLVVFGVTGYVWGLHEGAKALEQGLEESREAQLAMRKAAQALDQAEELRDGALESLRKSREIRDEVRTWLSAKAIR